MLFYIRMVFGNYYSIQYEIHITKEIDFYDDLLPIWMEVRSRIEMEKDKQTGNYKLIVIHYDEFYQQLRNNSLFQSYSSENDKMSKNFELFDFRKLKYIAVRQYEKFIRHNSGLPEPITKEEFEQLCIEKLYIEKSLFSEELCLELERKYAEICKQFKIQRIIHDPEYFEEIKTIHKQLLELVHFNEEQRERIQKVICHPKLEGIISWHGLKLVDGYC